MIGWSAVTGTIGWQALAMFAIIFFWTPPHTWALAAKYKEDYRAAGVPMLPVVAAEQQVTRQIVIYVADGGGDPGIGPSRGLAVRVGGRTGRRLVPDAGTPVCMPGCGAANSQAAAPLPALQQLPGRGVRRIGGRFGAGAADGVLSPARISGNPPGATARSTPWSDALEIAMGLCGLGQRVVATHRDGHRAVSEGVSNSPARQANSSGVRRKWLMVGLVR